MFIFENKITIEFALQHFLVVFFVCKSLVLGNASSYKHSSPKQELTVKECASCLCHISQIFCSPAHCKLGFLETRLLSSKAQFVPAPVPSPSWCVKCITHVAGGNESLAPGDTGVGFKLGPRA